MGFLDKAKETFSEATKAAQEGVADLAAKRKADALLRELGAWSYARHKGGYPDAEANITRVLGELAAHEAEHGELGSKEPAPTGASDVPPPPEPPPTPAPPAPPVPPTPTPPGPTPTPTPPPTPPSPPDPSPVPGPPPEPPVPPTPPVPPAPVAEGDDDATRGGTAPPPPT